MSVTVDADANTILISQDSNAVAVSQLGGLVTVVDPDAGRLSVLFPENAIAVSTPGLTGPLGPTGPAGPTGTSNGPLDDLTDVLIVSAADGDVLKYSQGLGVWTNTNKLDGGNF
jgi:hypothetical protein